MGGWVDSWGEEGTFGVREDDGGDGGAPVGDADGEIARLELVHAHHLPPRRRIGRAEAGGARARAQQREEQLRSRSHDQATPNAGVAVAPCVPSCAPALRLNKDGERGQKQTGGTTDWPGD